MNQERLKELAKELPGLNSGAEFSDWMGNLLSAHEELEGLTILSKSHDPGFDLDLRPRSFNYYLQLKLFKAKVGADQVDNFVGVLRRSQYKNIGLLITLNEFSESAIEAAEGWVDTQRVLLIDLPHLKLLASGKVTFADWFTALAKCHEKTKKHLISVEELQPFISKLQDSPTEGIPKLTQLEISGVGPVESIAFSPFQRMNLITGENGLGKSFLLECLWWVHSGHWSGRPAYPRQGATPSIDFTFSDGSKEKTQQAEYDLKSHSWSHPHPQEHSLVLYVGASNRISVWDPIKGSMPISVGTNQKQSPLVFSPSQVWDGIHLDHPDTWLSNGLLRDWVRWQSSNTRLPFATLEAFLSRLSPDNEPLQAGDIVRLPDDARDQPTIRYPHGDVPLVLAAAGVRRILSLAYMTVWLWHEHQIACKALDRSTLKHMVVLIDEIEAHIHPRWQRLLPAALLDLAKLLDFDLNIQFFVTTHSPMITASLEPYFDPEKDGLFHFDLDEKGQPIFEQLPFIKQGRVDQWYTSDVFELPLARSLEAERAIKEAEALQLEDKPDSDEVRKVSERLGKVLGEQDSFWPTWTWFAKQNGVDL
jgi:hypothetical protein